MTRTKPKLEYLIFILIQTEIGFGFALLYKPGDCLQSQAGRFKKVRTEKTQSHFTMVSFFFFFSHCFVSQLPSLYLTPGLRFFRRISRKSWSPFSITAACSRLMSSPSSTTVSSFSIVSLRIQSKLESNELKPFDSCIDRRRAGFSSEQEGEDGFESSCKQLFSTFRVLVFTHMAF